MAKTCRMQAKQPRPVKKVHIYKAHLQKCRFCQSNLVCKTSRSVAAGRLFSSESITGVASQAKYCPKCRVYIRANFIWLGGQKVNCMSFNQLLRSGLYFVTTNTAFTMKYLELCYLRLLRAKTSPGQEAAVRSIADANHEEMFWSDSLRKHLLHAIEGYAVAKRQPEQVVEFNLDFPAKTVVKIKEPALLFPPSVPVTSVAFDGHFGVHRALLTPVESHRQVPLKGRPMKLLHEHDRSCHCAKKDSVRHVLPDRTAGWQFAVDPCTGKVLGAYEHVVNERNEDKVNLLRQVLSMPLVSADLLLHDDACHFETYVKKQHCKVFQNIQYYMVDCFHMRNHRCSKATWTAKEKKRVKNVRTNMSETFNAWIRPLNFFLNSLRPHSHKFWVEEAILFHNQHAQPLSSILSSRTNAKSRSMRPK